MIKILLDPQIFNDQKFGGISRYYTEIYSHLNKFKDVQTDCPLFFTDNIHYKESDLFQDTYQQKNSFRIKYSKFFRAYRPKKLKQKNIDTTINLLTQKKCDLFIPTYYDPYFLSQLGNTPFVLTVYDMIHELFPQYFSGDKITTPRKKILIEKATRIIAISESTKKDILNIYPHIDPHKIDVVYLAHAIKPISDIRVHLPDNYILFVGNRSLYKNFTFFIKAIAPILINSPDLILLCAGGNSFNKEEQLVIKELSIEDQVIQRNFEDAELPSYYKNAKCFVFPSEYEGFGIPVLEAMACECPVVLANHSSFPEVAGDAGIYFALNDAEDLRQKVNQVLESPEIRQTHVMKGLEQSKKFNWEKTTLQCLNIYKKAL